MQTIRYDSVGNATTVYTLFNLLLT